MSFPHIWTNTQRLVFFVKFMFGIFCLGIVVYLVWFLCFFCRIICVCFMLPVIKKLFQTICAKDSAAPQKLADWLRYARR